MVIRSKKGTVTGFCIGYEVEELKCYPRFLSLIPLSGLQLAVLSALPPVPSPFVKSPPEQRKHFLSFHKSMIFITLLLK